MRDKLFKKVDNCLLIFDENKIIPEKNRLPLACTLGQQYKTREGNTRYGKTTGYSN
jgi:hypothetical protein